MLDKQSTLEALLNRQILKPDTQLINQFLKDKAVLVAGAGGSIGSALCRQIIRSRPTALVLYEHSEPALFAVSRQLKALLAEQKDRFRVKIVPVLGSIGDPKRLGNTLAQHGVQVVFHAAAYKQVDLLEKNVIAGVHNNIFGTRTLAHTAMDYGVESLVFVSTDKAHEAKNIMGATKRFAEQMLQTMVAEAKGTRLAIVRFGNVLESSGSVVPLFQQQILAGGPVTVTHPDISREFLTAAEAAQLILQAGTMTEGNDIFTLALSKPLRIVDLARKLIRLMGYEECVACAGKACECEKGIRIRYIGLRAGENLAPDIVSDFAMLEQTEHPNIFRLNTDHQDTAVLKAILGQLDTACMAMDVAAARKVLDHALRFQGTRLETPEAPVATTDKRVV